MPQNTLLPHETSATADRSAEALEQALDSVPFFADWRSKDPGRSHTVQSRYAALPALTKADIRAHFPQGFVPRGVDFEAELRGDRISYVSTSGSTSDQVTLFWSQPWWDASERQSWTLNANLRRAATGDHREAVLASPRCVGPYRPGETLPVDTRTLGRLLFLNQTINPAAWTPDDVHRILRELDTFRPVVLEADPFYLAALAAFAIDHRLTVFQPEVITLTYSFPAEVFLRLIRRVFTAPLVSSHGSTETGYVFMQCECGRMHQNTASCHVDFAPLETRPSGVVLGRLLVTPFGHPAQRFLRFDIGDLAEIRPDAVCPCGRTEGLTLERLVGRSADVTRTRDGRSMTVADVDAVLAEIPGVRAFQIDQAATGRISARIILAPQPAADAERTRVEAALAHVYGFPVTATCVSALEHEASGKVRLARPQKD
jgi:phenylacetate-CoA ligase